MRRLPGGSQYGILSPHTDGTGPASHNHSISLIQAGLLGDLQAIGNLIRAGVMFN